MNPDIGAYKASHKVRNLAVMLVVIAIAAFVGVLYAYDQTTYGCFCVGGTASVSAEVLSCTSVNTTCRIQLNNIGEQNQQANGCYFVNGTVNIYGTLADSFGKSGKPVEVQAGASAIILCTDPRSPTSGSQAVGYVQMNVGSEIPFSSTWY